MELFLAPIFMVYRLSSLFGLLEYVISATLAIETHFFYWQSYKDKAVITINFVYQL